jgi:hypothetical protein
MLNKTPSGEKQHNDNHRNVLEALNSISPTGVTPSATPVAAVAAAAAATAAPATVVVLDAKTARAQELAMYKTEMKRKTRAENSKKLMEHKNVSSNTDHTAATTSQVSQIKKRKPYHEILVKWLGLFKQAYRSEALSRILDLNLSTDQLVPRLNEVLSGTSENHRDAARELGWINDESNRTEIDEAADAVRRLKKLIGLAMEISYVSTNNQISLEKQTAAAAAGAAAAAAHKAGEDDSPASSRGHSRTSSVGDAAMAVTPSSVSSTPATPTAVVSPTQQSLPATSAATARTPLTIEVSATNTSATIKVMLAAVADTTVTAPSKAAPLPLLPSPPAPKGMTATMRRVSGSDAAASSSTTTATTTTGNTAAAPTIPVPPPRLTTPGGATTTPASAKASAPAKASVVAPTVAAAAAAASSTNAGHVRSASQGSVLAATKLFNSAATTVGAANTATPVPQRRASLPGRLDAGKTAFLNARTPSAPTAATTAPAAAKSNVAALAAKLGSLTYGAMPPPQKTTSTSTAPTAAAAGAAAATSAKSAATARPNAPTVPAAPTAPAVPPAPSRVPPPAARP